MSKLNATNIISLVAVLLIAVFVIHSFIVTEQENHDAVGVINTVSDIESTPLVLIDPRTMSVCNMSTMQNTGYRIYYALDINTDVVYYYACSDKKVLMTPIMNSDGTCVTASQLGIEYRKSAD